MPRPDYPNKVCVELMRLLSAERKRRGLSLNRLASETGLNQSTISRLESDPQNPTMDSLLRVAEVLQVDLGLLLSQAIKIVSKETKSSSKR